MLRPPCRRYQPTAQSRPRQAGRTWRRRRRRTYARSALNSSSQLCLSSNAITIYNSLSPDIYPGLPHSSLCPPCRRYQRRARSRPGQAGRVWRRRQTHGHPGTYAARRSRCASRCSTNGRRCCRPAAATTRAGPTRSLSCCRHAQKLVGRLCRTCLRGRKGLSCGHACWRTRTGRLVQHVRPGT